MRESDGPRCICCDVRGRRALWSNTHAFHLTHVWHSDCLRRVLKKGSNKKKQRKKTPAWCAAAPSRECKALSQPFLFSSIWFYRQDAKNSPEWMLASYVSADHRCDATLCLLASFMQVCFYVILKELCKCPLQRTPCVNGIILTSPVRLRNNSYSHKTRQL